jgi:subtilisin-like proprotein convertase family protein
MKNHLIASCVAVILAAHTATAALYEFNSGFANAGLIPDANPSGWTDTRTLTGIGATSLADLNVILNITGGFNGDLYAYLFYQATPGGTGIMSLLLNQVGKETGTVGSPTYVYGFNTAGFANVTLDDQGASGDIHTVANPTSGINVAYTTDGGSLASFNNLNPNGTWTLFIADLAVGSQSQVTSWALEIIPVPEPASMALLVIGGLTISVSGLRRWLARSGRSD